MPPRTSCVDRDLQLLRCVVRPHGQNVQIALNFHHVVEDQREVLAVADVQLHRATGRTIEAKQAVRVVVVDRDRRLRADLDAVALVLDLAFVVGVGDRRQHRAGVELLHELARPNFRDKPGRLQFVTTSAIGKRP